MQKKRMILLVIALLVIIILFLIIPLILSESLYISPDDGSYNNDTFIQKGLAAGAAGSSSSIIVGTVANGNESRGIIMFNISNISSTNTIIDAKIQLYLSNSQGKKQNRTIKLYRMTSDWSETDANWTNKDISTLWNTNGGDIDNTDELNYSIVSNKSGVYYNFSIPTYIIKGWINGTYPNYGILILSNDTLTGNFSIFASSNSPTPEQKPKIIINYTENAIPIINNILTDSSVLSPIEVGNNVNISVYWNDLENDFSKVYVCNSSNINYSGCMEKTYCSTYGEQDLSSCLYTVQYQDNTTTNFYIGVCDDGSKNCSISPGNFSVNHAPNINIIHPNGGELVNQSAGNYEIKFNVSDLDNNPLLADIYYSETRFSTNHIIESSINLLSYCTDFDSLTSTKNNCSYIWNSTGIWGNYYLTIKVHDTINGDIYSESINSSSTSFNVRSIIDTSPPNLTSQWIDSGIIHSGKTVQFFANVSDINLNNIWLTINSTPEINLTMSHLVDDTYYVNWTAIGIGNYEYKVYASDIVGNINDSMIPQMFSIDKPIASTQNEIYPSSALPLSIIKITGELNSTDNLIGVHAKLNVPQGFTFLNDYEQDKNLGDMNYNETKEAVWIIAVPFNENTYTLNITYSDNFSNTWQSNGFNVQVTSSMGEGGSGDYFAISGYPEVEADEAYYVEAYFLSSGTYSNTDSTKISILNPNSVTIISNDYMQNKTTGIYNYSYIALQNQQLSGIWTTLINASRSGINYQAKQFWRMLTYSFDVKNIQVIDPRENHLNFSVYIENKGDAGTDTILVWNLTNSSGEISSGSETPFINAGQNMTYNFSLEPISYTGDARITVTVYYPQNKFSQKAISYKDFTIVSSSSPYCGDNSCNNQESCSTCEIDCGVCPITPPSNNGGGGGISIVTNLTNISNIANEKNLDYSIDFKNPVYIARSIDKTEDIVITNTGDEDINNLILSLDLDNSFYKILSGNITKLKKHEIGTFKVKYTVKDIIDKKDFNYIITSNEKEKKYPVVLIMLNSKDYFLSEIKRLNEKRDFIKSNIASVADLKKLDLCNILLNKTTSEVNNENYIDASSDIVNTDDCLDKIKFSLEKPMPLIQNYSWYITWILIFVLIIVIIIGSIIIYRRLSLINFFENKTNNIRKESIKEDDFNKRIDDIKKKLKY